MMRHGVAADIVERLRVSAPGSPRQERSDSPEYTPSMLATWAKTGLKRPKESPGCIGIVGNDFGRIRREEGGHFRGMPKKPLTNIH
jgi:hypothetical protein